VQESHGAKGYNWEAINVEMAGINFDDPENFPPENEIRLTVRLREARAGKGFADYLEVLRLYDRLDAGPPAPGGAS